MVFQICMIAAVTILAVLVYVLWTRCEVLLNAVAKLSNGFVEHQKWTVNKFKDFDDENELIEKRISGVEDKVAELPTEQLKEVAEQEANFLDGLNNILNFNIANYGLNNGGVTHE